MQKVVYYSWFSDREIEAQTGQVSVPDFTAEVGF